MPLYTISPVHSSSISMAKLYTSAGMAMAPFCSTSGAMYATVPAQGSSGALRSHHITAWRSHGALHPVVRDSMPARSIFRPLMGTAGLGAGMATAGSSAPRQAPHARLWLCQRRVP